jgi:vacuolar protein 8
VLPLVALLGSPSVGAQENAAGALFNLAGNGKCASERTCRGSSVDCAGANNIAIAAAGAVPPLVALLASPSVVVQKDAAWVLWSLAGNGMCASKHACCHGYTVCADANQIAIAAAGAVPPLIAILASPSVDAQFAAAGAL